MNGTIRADRLFTGHELFEPGELLVAAGRVVSVGPATGSRADTQVHTLVPGFVDAHNHGGGGVSFADDPRRAAAAHRRQGTTTTLASLVSEPLDVLEAQVTRLAPFVADGTLGGLHLEGPWLSAAYCGAHDPDVLRAPNPADVDRLFAAADGTIRMVTIAPELLGALEAIRQIVGYGAVAAVGHTNATAHEVRAALAAGASGATHLFNAMRGLHHRQPGPVLALMENDHVWLELIADGVHLDLDLVRWVFGVCPSRAVLITDAMAAACCGDGRWQLGALDVDVVDGVARLAGTGTIAGSTITLDVAVRRAIAAGVPWMSAVRAATVLPATYLGLPEAGSLRPGGVADAVALDGQFGVERVLSGGDWLT